MAPPSTSAPSWVILDTTPRVSSAGELQPGTSVSLAPAAPPRVSQLVVAAGVAFPTDPDPHARIASPLVLAADPSGLFLVAAPPSVSERPPTRARACRGADGVERTIHVGPVPQPAYFVLDVPSDTAARTPDTAADFNPACVGIVAAPGGRGRGYMVVELQTIVGCRKATLLCFSSETSERVEVYRVRNPLPRWIWSFDDVVSHDGKLWWIDFAKGLLACDPLADKPHMAYVTLPNGGGHGGGLHGCSYCSQRNLASRRYVQVSNGKFHCVEMSCPRQCGAPTVIMHTLEDPETAEWTPGYAMDFAEFWATDRYKAAGLPKKAPSVALINPKNPDFVYFSVNGYFFVVLMGIKKLMECKAHDGEGAVTSSSFLAWELPPMLPADLLGRFLKGVQEETGPGEATI